MFNNGDQERDFTYIDDIVAGVVKIVDEKDSQGYSLYNIGNSEPINLLKFIEEIEKKLGKSAQKEMLPMQPGDVERTWADVESLKRNFDYKPNTEISYGVEQFVKWYKNYYINS